ncbi:2OG-Fe(II) oxygenase [Sphingomonas radiodurans]|uniref:2OG-Fe(II) oxygenase n=1 Tax=Sphingomonas radiodurans TaxID=2890321 RepID=UPI001E59379E|nr:2OG-Fe(II) oxygenase [Sphingomonas radiodurans]WBH15096.1 2OG-Fe(II) oxygenase [Sphingomonas radiodurans]
MNSFIDFNYIEDNIERLRLQYRDASPFEHLVIDGFLTRDGLNTIRKEGFFKTASTKESSSDFLFAKNKIENPRIEHISGSTRVIREELLSDRFRLALSRIVSMDLFVDPSFTGGGLHQGGKGSFLEMHADFTRHPLKKEWIRELNILLYLNKDYEESWGGCLDLQHAETGEKASISPVENRAVIMLTKRHTLHGYKPIRFPSDRFRTSIAAYAYTIDDGTRDVEYASTTWIPQSRLKRALATVLNPLVITKQKLLGSRTARRAQR